MKKLCILIFILIAGQATAATIAKRFDTLQTLTIWMAGMDTAHNQMTGAQVKLYVNASIQRVSSDFDAVRRSGAILCTKGTSVYAADSNFKSLIAARRWVYEDTLTRPLRVVSAYTYYEEIQKGKPVTDAGDEPQYIYSWGKSLTLDPAPNSGDSILYNYAAVGNKLSSATDTTDILEPYRELVVIYAAWLACIDGGKYEQAEKLIARYNAALAK